MPRVTAPDVVERPLGGLEALEARPAHLEPPGEQLGDEVLGEAIGHLGRRLEGDHARAAGEQRTRELAGTGPDIELASADRAPEPSEGSLDERFPEPQSPTVVVLDERAEVEAAGPVGVRSHTRSAVFDAARRDPRRRARVRREMSIDCPRSARLSRACPPRSPGRA
jgi:hypothetical protein